jgi:hypothetical protein
MVSKEAKEVYDELIEVYRKRVERGLTREAGYDAAIRALRRYNSLTARSDL